MATWQHDICVAVRLLFVCSAACAMSVAIFLFTVVNFNRTPILHQGHKEKDTDKQTDWQNVVFARCTDDADDGNADIDTLV